MFTRKIPKLLHVERSLQNNSFITIPKQITFQQNTISTGSAAVEGPLHYLNGERIQPQNSDTSDDITVIEPATGKPLCTMRGSGQKDVDNAVQSAKEAFRDWSDRAGRERGAVLRRAADIIKANLEDISKIETMDNGKPIWEARMDTEGCADAVDYFGGIASTIGGRQISLPNHSMGYTRREPLGVVGAIGAFNYPLQMASWKSAPALACGNTVVFKPSPLTPLTALMLAEIYKEAGLPDGCFNVIQGEVKPGQMLTSHPNIAKMTFTGSVPTGSKVMEACAKDVKHVTLELGGKSPILIFPDCDIDNAVNGTMIANFLTQGQVCINGTRVYVHKSIMEIFLSKLVAKTKGIMLGDPMDENTKSGAMVCSNGTRVYVHKSIMQTFLSKLVAKTKGITLGDPMDENTKSGAMISEAQARKVLGYVETAKKEGGQVLCGGERVILPGNLAGGWYISPCIVANVQDHMTIAREEVFGPVVSILEFEDEDDVIRRANDSIFGLASGVFTKDLQRAQRVTAKLEAGNVYVNNYNIYPPEMPFGGYKKSGLGRECGVECLEYFTQVKTVYMEGSDEVWSPF